MTKRMDDPNRIDPATEWPIGTCFVDSDGCFWQVSSHLVTGKAVLLVVDSFLVSEQKTDELGQGTDHPHVQVELGRIVHHGFFQRMENGPGARKIPLDEFLFAKGRVKAIIGMS